MERRVGYRFHPTDEELVDYFLRNKLAGTLRSDDIRELDICNFEPCDLPTYAAQGSDDDEWYFFHRRKPMPGNKSRPRYNRSTQTGHWRPTGKVRQVKSKRNRTEIGEKQTLVFYEYSEGKKQHRTNWVIHEYKPKAFPSHQADLVLCKLKEKADDKAETAACREAEPSRRRHSDFDVPPAELSFPEVDRQLLLQTRFPNDRVNCDQPNIWQSQIQIDEGISIDDLELSDDIFQSGSNGLRYQFETTELQEDPNEMDFSFFGVADEFNGENNLVTLSADAFGYDLEEAASNARTNLNHSSSARSPSGFYLEDITDTDSEDFNWMPSQFGDSSLNNGHTRPKEYRQVQSVQSLTETLPAPKLELQACFESLHLSSRYEQSGAAKNLERHENFSSTGKASKISPIIVEAHARSNKNKVEVKMAAGKIQIQAKSSGTSESKARKNLPCKLPKETITLKTESDQKMGAAKTILMSTSHTEKTCSSINTETSLLYQRSIPVSVYIINVSIGLFLFVAAIEHLLIFH